MKHWLGIAVVALVIFAFISGMTFESFVGNFGNALQNAGNAVVTFFRALTT